MLRQVSDSKGDTVEYPKAVTSVPFTDQGNTYFFNDDYQLACGTADQNRTAGSKVRPCAGYFVQPHRLAAQSAPFCIVHSACICLRCRPGTRSVASAAT